MHVMGGYWTLRRHILAHEGKGVIFQKREKEDKKEVKNTMKCTKKKRYTS